MVSLVCIMHELFPELSLDDILDIRILNEKIYVFFMENVLVIDDKDHYSIEKNQSYSI